MGNVATMAAPSGDPLPEPTPSPRSAQDVGSSRRSPRSLVTVVLAALVLGGIIVTRLGSREEGAAAAAPAATGSPTPTTADIALDPGPVPAERYSLIAEGVPFSIVVPTAGWENHGQGYISKSSVGSQGAEAIIYWTSIAGGEHAHPCGQWWGAPPGSLADFAVNAADVPGTELVTPPSAVSVGGLGAQHLVFTVRRDVGCDPGFFYRWPDDLGGAFWTSTEVGDTIRVWIVDVGETRLFIEGDTHENAGAELAREVRQIIRSIRFD